MSRTWRRYIICGIFAFVFGGTLSFLANSHPNDTDAASANFDAGNIISDYVMTNYNTMSEADIQNFINSRGNCGTTAYTGLNPHYYTSSDMTTEISADEASRRGEYYLWSQWWVKSRGQYEYYQHHVKNGRFVCMANERFSGDKGTTLGSGETVAHIIYSAAQEFKINPQVLLVLFEKEQGLISDDFPNSHQYGWALGFCATDSGNWDSNCAGIKRQVRLAASFYAAIVYGNPGIYIYPDMYPAKYHGERWDTFNGWIDRRLGTHWVQYHPNGACGGGNVNIQNYATLALYVYTPYQPNAAALATNYGTGDACSSYGNRNFYNLFNDWFGDSRNAQPSLEYIMANMDKIADEPTDLDMSYNLHIQDYGWMPVARGGEMTGTTGYLLRAEGVSIKINDLQGIEYRTHVQDIGWELSYHRDGALSGTTGRALRMEAIQIRLTNGLEQDYDVYYRTHVQDIGWMDWAKNDEISGTVGKSLRIEALQIKIVKKDQKTQTYYRTHVQDIGWMSQIKNGQTSGTTGQSKRLEAITVQIPSELQGNVYYRTHVQDIGWMDWAKNGETSGTTGQSLRMEAIEIKIKPKN